ncbi:UPF0187-domain-containing protein [Fomitopsis serialis]|uniref:UPF0187-domain-containing protein n=1 Tax=Fomitopsis serialis TaxID=139415 RepID=UPI002008C955|nr:UPF0187-domain-containing protein [Neoantrodia serialis]XP_047893258.1 UPF0187-domain-containing protein [Neoantrodia serialis]KAH9912457.1 UPF0187-domain-containing protein [Neoantrodia serialis]KAH9925770.1 UPF0187-domain-containing protein [Neoantrodia serialis]
MEQTLMNAVDPFSHVSGGFWSQLINAVTATAVIRCWPLLLFFTGWATAISVICRFVHNIGISSTLLTVIGTVLGFVVSYRTTSSFERYNEGRRLWSQIVLASRTFSRTIWFHVPEVMPVAANDQSTLEQRKERVLIEKKTAINLIEAFAVAVKHYLRGEEGVYYVDLYHLVKFLPSYALPAGLPSNIDLVDTMSAQSAHGDGTTRPRRPSDVRSARSMQSPTSPISTAPPMPIVGEGQLPLPATSPRRTTFANGLKPSMERDRGDKDEKTSTMNGVDEGFLLPARIPPRYHLLDLWPLSLIVHLLAKRGKDVKGRTAARIRAKLRSKTVTHNLPLEVSFYMSSYVAALQSRKVVDPPTATALIASLNQLVDALTGLERILTTPIPFSYRVHLWTVTLLYNFFLPFQIWDTLGWLTIPATALLSFIFFGFLVAGEEIENPFGYDKNDLNMDHFTHNIIRSELHALTAQPIPDPSIWVFSPYNDMVVGSKESERVSPDEWMQRGLPRFQMALSESI